jgi:hypothetical protein
MSKDKKILKKAHEARIFLRVHGFLPDRENQRIRERIDKQIIKNSKSKSR